MEIAGLGILMPLIYFVGFIFVVAALIYLIVKRINAKKKEDFEKRDN